MKYIFQLLSAVFCLSVLPCAALKATTYDSRTDSFHVVHYSIAIDLSDLSTKVLKGGCRLQVQSNMNGLDKVRIELYHMTIDSIRQGNKDLAYSYSDMVNLTVQLGGAYAKGDTTGFSVYYHGTTYQAPGGFGGFIFDTNTDKGYAFNLGVGISTIPHNLGKAWFPCLDDFTDRATYDFTILTPNTHKAFCNGLLTDSGLTANNSRYWHWNMRQPIPTYLASVAVGQYATIKSIYLGKMGTKEIQIGVPVADLQKGISAFKNLPKVLNIYEKYYGPYKFDRIGYVAVPFSGGAMEHASNITYPISGLDSSQVTLWGHELSHHWWGDQMTCHSAEDMWLNEGWASYSESFITEQLYGHKAYVNYSLANHYEVMHLAHQIDSGYRAVAPIPQKYTYSLHVYNKGADVAHTLRSYLGDSLFFKGIQGFLKDYTFKDATSDDFKNALSTYTGKDMSDFFNTWVYQPGWPHFEVTGYTLQQNGSNYTLKDLTLEQRTKVASLKGANVPVVVSAFDQNWKRYDKIFYSSGLDKADWTLPFKPEFTEANIDNQLCDATTTQIEILKKGSGVHSYPYALMTITTPSTSDSALLCLTHHWIGAERTSGTPSNIRLSPDRYWTVDGIFTDGFNASAVVHYDARNIQDMNNGNFDNGLLQGSRTDEDSIKLMYRSSPDKDWVEYDNYQLIAGSKTDLYGSIKINNLKRGQYTFGYQDKMAAVKTLHPKAKGLLVYPNPAQNTLHIRLEDAQQINSISLMDKLGREVYSRKNIGYRDNVDIDIRQLATGSYILVTDKEDGQTAQPVVINR